MKVFLAQQKDTVPTTESILLTNNSNVKYLTWMQHKLSL